MNNKEIQSLIKLISESNLSEFRLKDGDFKLTIRTKEYYKFKNQPAPAQVPMMVSQPAPAVQNNAPIQNTTSNADPSNDANNNQEVNSGLLEIKSPIVGTFYRASGPDKEPFVKVGDHISSDSVVCIVEAMKLFNEIEAEISGKIVDVLVEDATPIEYDQVLFLVDPKG